MTMYSPSGSATWCSGVQMNPLTCDFFLTYNNLKNIFFEHLKINFEPLNKSKEQINSILKFILAFLKKKKEKTQHQTNLI